MINGYDVAKQMMAYLIDKEKLDDFRAWLLCAHVDAANQQSKSPEQADAARLLMEIEARYAEFSDEILDELGLRRALARLVSPRSQSAESLLLSYFYSVPSVSSSEPSAQSGNAFDIVNYQPEPLAAVS